jgi:hypothetical protein
LLRFRFHCDKSERSNSIAYGGEVGRLLDEDNARADLMGGDELIHVVKAQSVVAREILEQLSL